MTPENDLPVSPTAESVGQTPGARTPSPTSAEATVPPFGKRQAFRDIRRQLADGDLSSPGVQKLILDELEESESECAELRAYVERFHDADKRAAVLGERLRPATAIEIMFGVGVGLGGAVIGLAPLFWTEAQQPRGYISLGIGVLLVLGSTLGRAVRR